MSFLERLLHAGYNFGFANASVRRTSLAIAIAIAIVDGVCNSCDTELAAGGRRLGLRHAEGAVDVRATCAPYARVHCARCSSFWHDHASINAQSLAENRQSRR